MCHEGGVDENEDDVEAEVAQQLKCQKPSSRGDGWCRWGCGDDGAAGQTRLRGDRLGGLAGGLNGENDHQNKRKHDDNQENRAERTGGERAVGALSRVGLNALAVAEAEVLMASGGAFRKSTESTRRLWSHKTMLDGCQRSITAFPDSRDISDVMWRFI
jgi:hypothetical protein